MDFNTELKYIQDEYGKRLADLWMDCVVPEEIFYGYSGSVKVIAALKFLLKYHPKETCKIFRDY